MNGANSPRSFLLPAVPSGCRRFRLAWIVPGLLGAVLAWAVGVEAIAADPPATQPTVAAPRSLLSPVQKREEARKVIDAFVAHVKQSSAVSPGAKTAVEQGWARSRQDEEPAEFLTAGVAIISEPYKKALEGLDKEAFEQAEAGLRPLVNDPDPYVSLHAQALLARALVEQDKLEEAEELLLPLAAGEDELIARSFLEADVDFLLAYCQLSNLHYDAARASLLSFENQHADAPERLRLPARQMLQELVARRPESLGEVSDLMVYAGRRLGTGQAGKPVQAKQDRAIELLNKLIKDAEDQENQQNNSNNQENQGSGSQNQQRNMPQGADRSPSPATDSIRPQGQGKIGDLNRSGVARPGEEWGKMPPEEREKVLQSLRRNFPSQYRQLVEQYYKQLAKEK